MRFAIESEHLIGGSILSGKINQSPGAKLLFDLKPELERLSLFRRAR
jgi:hypothetical protein